ncbi:MAG: HWE histidine kinase domain-containing protein [Phenylobacterium sp.]|uniref:ATP-binding protein n=1 Tax=Phenylobacterium sp. TaxID=1871053 RepID=UPI0027363F2C|nr:ATP-binding protein [Phenylobacterium sp.]MDP3746110.1 HWE histidine kinase domain-containing protein [Phenylobacterium sp.]
MRQIPLVASLCAVSLLVVGLVMGAYNESLYRTQKIREVEVQAQVVAASLTAALAFDDIPTAREYLGALRANPEVEAAGAYGADGDLLASYARTRDQPLPSRAPAHGASFEHDRLVVVAPVIQSSAPLGSIYLRTLTEPLARRIVRYAGIALLMVMASLVVVGLGYAHAALRKVNTQLTDRAQGLAEIDRAKTSFFSSVSHEFRTPLTLMLAPIEGLLARPEQEISAKNRTLLEVAHRNAQRLLKLVNTLLDFSRIEAGRTQAVYEPTDLAAFTAELTSNFHSACSQAGLALGFQSDPGLTHVYVDRDMWEKIVLNLVSNAFKFTFDGRIAVSLHKVGEAVELAVRDTGVGVEAHELARIFERFHRVEGQRGRTHEGTGIGLALVQELVKLHGGTIRAESTAGVGSAFIVTIPLREADPTPSAGPRRRPDSAPAAAAYAGEALQWLPDAEEMAQAVAGQAPLAAAEGGRPHLLLADDNADMRAYVRRILEEGGYDVRAVATGEAALAEARAGPAPDLVVTDVMMPGALDGFGLLKALRADPATESVPVLLLSARAGEEARVEGLEAGADDYIVKPFGARELLARIESAIRLARLRRTVAARDQELETARAQAKLRLAMDAAKMGEVVFDIAAGKIVHTPGFALLFGYPGDRRLSLGDVEDRYHSEDREDVLAAKTVKSGLHEFIEVEHRVIWPDGSVRWLAGRGDVKRDASGAPIEVTSVYMDVTERKGAEGRQRLLLDELNHRVKNTLATVQSIAMQTERNVESAADFSEAFQGRIAALAQAHDLLTLNSWEGATLADVVARTLAPYAAINGDGAPRVAATGPLVTLGVNAAVTLNMAFHELATNASKYGSLSASHGRLDVDWTVDRSIDPAVVEIAWIEQGGPRVEPPRRRGVGSRLVQQGLARELDGEVDVQYDPAGVRCRIRLPSSSKVSLG